MAFFGTTGAFSPVPLGALLDAGADVRAVVVPAARAAAPVALLRPAPSRSSLPLQPAFVERTVVQLAWERGIDVFAVGRLRSPEAVALLRSLELDVACVACFPWRVPPELLQLPRHGFLNVHPSLLPHFRGPAPLFWVFRHAAPAGVTVHLMDQGFDTGAILSQAPIRLPDGISAAAADRLCAELGGRLLVDALAALQAGQARPRPQAGGSHYGWPQPADFALDLAWPARRAYNFVRGTDAWGQPYTVAAGGARLQIAVALSFHPDQTLGVPYRVIGDELLVQFAPGVLRARGQVE